MVGSPLKIRTDYGTENGDVAAFQTFQSATILMMTGHTYMVQIQEIKELRADGDNMEFWTELFKFY